MILKISRIFVIFWKIPLGTKIDVKVSDFEKLYLWEIKEADAFIELELGELQESTDRYFSINPYSFLPEQPLS